MTDQIVADTAASLRTAADFIEAHPQLPVPYITSYPDGDACLDWYLMLAHHNMTPTDQAIAALTIFDAVGGTWEQRDLLDVDDQPITKWDQSRDGLRFHVQVRREVAEVCS